MESEAWSTVGNLRCVHAKVGISGRPRVLLPDAEQNESFSRSPHGVCAANGGRCDRWHRSPGLLCLELRATLYRVVVGRRGPRLVEADSEPDHVLQTPSSSDRPECFLGRVGSRSCPVSWGRGGRWCHGAVAGSSPRGGRSFSDERRFGECSELLLM